MLRQAFSMLGIRHLVAFLALFAVPATAPAQDHVVITGESVNIRTTPGGTIVGQASSGDVFKLGKRDAGWFAIFMFSGEHRLRSCVSRSSHRFVAGHSR